MGFRGIQRGGGRSEEADDDCRTSVYEQEKVRGVFEDREVLEWRGRSGINL